MQNLADLQIRCPGCRGATLAPAPDGEDEAACPACGARHPIHDGFLDLLPPELGERTLAQATMEWPPLIRIYESRLWRRSPLFSALAGISFEREHELVAGAADFAPDHQVLDLACGSGIYARRFARAASRGTVVGLDLSAPMLRYAARRRDAAGLRNLALVRGSAMDLPFDDGRFDRVNCCGALHLFPDPRHVIGEIARALRPDGRFTLAAFRQGDGGWSQRLAHRRARVYGVQSFTPSQLGDWLEDAGLADPRCLHEARSWLVMSAVRPGAAPAASD